MRYVKKYFENPIIEQEILNNWMNSNGSDEDKKYNEPNVRAFLRRVYHGCCAYCECSPEVGSYFEIEHFYPKSMTRKHDNPVVKDTFHKEIKNLHYSCPRCNKRKGTFDTTKKTILTDNYYYDFKAEKWIEVSQEEIDKHIVYNKHLLYPLSKEAKRTIEMFDLNGEKPESSGTTRAYLVRCRLIVYLQAFLKIKKIYEALEKYRDDNCIIISDDDKRIKSLFKELYLYYLDDSAQFNTMIYQNFGHEIVLLLNIYQELLKSKH